MLSENGTTFTYDDKGNRIERNDNGVITKYSWDSSNRLIGVDSPGASFNFTYDVDGNRISKESSSGVTHYLVDSQNPSGFAQVIEERDDTGGLITSYTYGDDLISSIQSGSNRFYHYDAHGNTRMLTDNTETVTDQYTYDAYGNVTASAGLTQNEYLYSGEQFDPDLNAYYLRARYYDPSTGRFLSRDSFSGELRSPLSQHAYLYANANPANFIDPSGNVTLIELGIVQAISTTIRSIKLGGQVARFCVAKGKADTLMDGFLLGITIMTAAVEYFGTQFSYNTGSDNSVTLFKVVLPYPGPTEFINSPRYGTLPKAKTTAKRKKFVEFKLFGSPELAVSLFGGIVEPGNNTSLKLQAGFSGSLESPSPERFWETFKGELNAELTLLDKKTCGISWFSIKASVANSFNGEHEMKLKGSAEFIGGAGKFNIEFLRLDGEGAVLLPGIIGARY